MSWKVALRIAGSGGQGVVFSGRLLAEAAVEERLEVCATNSYGPEVRGSVTYANILLSDEPLDCPRPEALDVLVALTQEVCDHFFHELHKEKSTLLVDSSRAQKIPSERAYGAPFSTLSQEKFGTPLAGNTIAVGTVATLTGLLRPASLRKALLRIGAEKLRATNLQALELGFRLGRKLRSGKR